MRHWCFIVLVVFGIGFGWSGLMSWILVNLVLFGVSVGIFFLCVIDVLDSFALVALTAFGWLGLWAIELIGLRVCSERLG